MSWYAAQASVAAVALVVLVMANGVSANEAGLDRSPARSVPLAGRAKRPPVLAYYYVWFDARAWARGKSDYPLLGRYASSDIEVMRQHIRWAKDAGVDGFIVSWRHSEALDPRLAQLAKVAAGERFKLVIIYQGLDFLRGRRAVETVRSDLVWFADHYSGQKAFKLFRRPTVIISGSESYPREELDQMVAPVRHRLDVLGSEKSVEGYERIRDVVDGNAYYWSSVDPATYPAYERRLSAMARAVHRDHGLWIAPAATGFDSTRLGKPTIVDRRNGSTLRRELTAALGSHPNAVGLISWNEFSENTHIEPSLKYGTRSLDVLSQMLGGKPTKPLAQVSPSAPTDRVFGDPESDSGAEPSWGGLRALGVFIALMLVVTMMLVRSQRRRRSGDALRRPEAARPS